MKNFLCCLTFSSGKTPTIKFRKKAPDLVKALFDVLIFGVAYIRRGLCTEGNLRLKADWASLILGRKFTVFSLPYLLLLF